MVFSQGIAVGVSDGSEILQTWHPGLMADGFATLLSLFQAFGWGYATSPDRSDPRKVTINMIDCFECSSPNAGRRSCEFVRGFLTGSAGTLLGREVKCEEVVCRFRGGEYCEFVVDTSPAETSASLDVR